MSGDRRPPRFPLAGEASHPLETAAVWMLGLVVALGASLWLAGELSGRVFGGSWPHVSVAEAGRILVGFHAHAGHPALAWPPSQQRLIPGPVPFYVTLGLILAVGSAAGLLILRRRGQADSRSSGSARWAGTRDLRLLRIKEPVPGRLTLGRVDGRLVAAEPKQSVIVVGPVQTGKTTGFAVPAILEWKGPVVATSVKTDLLNETVAARSAIVGSSVWVYDPTGGTGHETAHWTPLGGCQTWQGAQRIASWLVRAVRSDAAGVENAQFWYAGAEKLLAPILLAAQHSARTMADVVRWIDTQEQEEVQWGLALAGEQAAIDAFTASSMHEKRTRSNIYTTCGTVLTAFADPSVLAAAAIDEFRPETLLDGRWHTAYLCAPAHEQRRLQPLFATLVQAIAASAYDRATETGKPLDPPLLLVLDECANIAPLRELATLASTGAGQGIQLVSVFQDLAQINAVYGRDRAPTIVSNHRAKVILSGIADDQTLDYIERVLGNEEVKVVASTSDARGARSQTESVTHQRLAPANVLREMEPGSGLLIYGHLAPARITLRPWFKDRRLRELAGGALP